MSSITGEPDPEPELPPVSSAQPEIEAELPLKPSGLTKIDKSLTEIPDEVIDVPAPEPPRRGRPPRQTHAPVTWSVRGVTRDTRTVLEQAARRAGKPLGQYLNEDVRQLVEGQKPSAEPADLQAQVHYLRQLVENLVAMLSPAPGQPGPDRMER